MRCEKDQGACVFWLILGVIVVLVALSLRRRPVQPYSTTTPSSSPPPDPPPRPASRHSGAALQWMGSGTSLHVGGFNLVDPLTYTSEGTPTDDEASCINIKLPVGEPVREERGALGYWPRYSRLTPTQRANYLAWLAGGRKSPLDDIGYAFIFFYGLERRALVDDADMKAILTEADRLMLAYSTSRSFFACVSRFLAFVLATVGLENIPCDSSEIAFERNLKEFNEDTLAVALAWVFKANIPLPPFLAYETTRNDIRASRSVVVTRVAEHFKALFHKKYRERFGAGLTLKSAARERTLYYKPESPSLLGWHDHRSAGAVRIPNVLGLSSQFKPLIEIWDECIEELKPLSREAGKGKDVDTRAAYQALPDALKSEIDHPDKAQWEKFVSDHTGENNVALTTVADIAPLCGFAERAKLTRGQSEELAATANDVGFILVPDSRIVNRPYKWDDFVALFRPDTKPSLPEDKGYRAVVLLLEMGIAVAASDGEIEPGEVGHMLDFLKSQFMLEPNDARRVDAYKEVLIRRPPALGNLAKRLQATLVAEQLELVCRYLVGVAAANGAIDKGERRTLAKFYTALGIDLSKLDGLLYQLAGEVPEAVEVQKGVPGPAGERIPARERPIVTLDERTLRNILMETEQVAAMLGAALSKTAEDEVAELAQSVNRPTASTMSISASSDADSRFEGLDSRYHSIVAALLMQDEWTREQFQELARRNGVMPAGMIESINSWADEAHGDFLIEEGNTYKINQTLLENT